MPEGLSALVVRVTLDNTGRESLDCDWRRTTHAQLGLESTAQRVKLPREFADESFVRMLLQSQRGKLLVHDPDRLTQLVAVGREDDQVIQVAHIKNAAGFQTLHRPVQGREIQRGHQGRKGAPGRDPKIDPPKDAITMHATVKVLIEQGSPLRIADMGPQLIHQDIGIDGVVVALHIGAKHVAMRPAVDGVMDLPHSPVAAAVAPQMGAAVGEMGLESALQLPGQRVEPQRILGRIDRRGALGRRAGGKLLDRAEAPRPRCMSWNARGTPGAIAGKVDEPPKVRS